MCYSSQQQPRNLLRSETSSSAFKRRCVSMSSMADIPSCPVVSGVLGGCNFSWKDDIVEVLPQVDLYQPEHGGGGGGTTADIVKHSCIVCGILQWARPSTSSNKEVLDSTFPRIFQVLRHSTQPAHVVVMVTVLLLAMLLVPRKAAVDPGEALESLSIAWPLLYLCSFSFLFGAQMWMTFVSGLVLLFVLPRHTFARVQSALFPKYMLLSSIAALATLAAFVEIHSRPGKWSPHESYQMVGLLTCCLAPLVARLYVVPGLLSHIAAKVALERAAGHGAEAGPKLDTLTSRSLNSCVVYGRICRSFRRRHMFVAIVNMVVLGCNVFHLYYLSSKIRFL